MIAKKKAKARTNKLKSKMKKLTLTVKVKVSFYFLCFIGKSAVNRPIAGLFCLKTVVLRFIYS